MQGLLGELEDQGLNLCNPASGMGSMQSCLKGKESVMSSTRPGRSLLARMVCLPVSSSGGARYNILFSFLPSGAFPLLGPEDVNSSKCPMANSVVSVKHDLKGCDIVELRY